MSSAADMPIPPQVLQQTIENSVLAQQSTFAFWSGIAKSTASVLLSLVVGTSTLLAGFVVRALAWLLTSLYALISWPVAQIYAPLRFLVSPVTYTLSYLFVPLVSLVHFVGRLRLGSAAFLGIVTGLLLKYVSSYFFVILSLDKVECAEADEDLESEVSQESSLYKTAPRRPSPQLDTKSKDAGRQPPSMSHSVLSPSHPAAVSLEGSKSPVEASDAGFGSQDDVWQWLQEFNPAKPTMAIDTDGENTAALLKRTSAQPGGLLALTIMEESSSE
ncbi:hypothetical protein SEPCBS119000_002802 [Sporothrix epigloea]|uniref:Yip1 domain-containing protein n=1 Tax=Sporothrix epigloea TaxID=1892477 RepID=A0ABP0DI56_9PEZI